MPTDEITINGFHFLAPSPYSEGHICTGAEATILNRKLHANLRANFAKLMDQMVVEGKSPDSFTRDLAKRFSDYCSTYSLNGTDQLEAEAHAIALAMVKAKFRKAGRALSEIGRAEIERQVEAILASPQRQDIYTQARARLKTLREAATRELARLSS